MEPILLTPAASGVTSNPATRGCHRGGYGTRSTKQHGESAPTERPGGAAMIAEHLAIRILGFAWRLTASVNDTAGAPIATSGGASAALGCLEEVQDDRTGPRAPGMIARPRGWRRRTQQTSASPTGTGRLAARASLASVEGRSAPSRCDVEVGLRVHGEVTGTRGHGHHMHCHRVGCNAGGTQSDHRVG